MSHRALEIRLMSLWKSENDFPHLHISVTCFRCILYRGHGKWKFGCWCRLCTLMHTRCPKDSNQQTLTHLWNGRPWLLSIRRLWVLWHAAMAPYADSAILSHLPLTTRSKVLLMLTNGETALCPQTEEGRYLFTRPEDGIMELRRDLTTPSLPFMMPQAGTS